MTESSWDEVRQTVYKRANGCCEYCQTCEVNTGQTMQVDHIDPLSGDDLDNLALACWNCNNHKRQATQAIDPESETEVRLFHPRNDIWRDHFVWAHNYSQIAGQTPIGRATIIRLKMNRPILVTARRRWVDGGYHRPE